MLRVAFAVALPALGLAWVLSQTDQSQRAVWLAGLRGVAPPTAPLVAAPEPRSRVAPTAFGSESFAVDADGRGQFLTSMLVSGRQIPVLIDTGATFVALTYEDAASIGLHPAEAEFKYQVRTANGSSRVAAVVLPEIRVGNVEARRVQALVAAPGTLTGQSLLGMSFLKQLSSFEIRSGQLILRQ